MTNKNETYYENQTDCEIVMAFCGEEIMNNTGVKLYTSNECK